MNEHILFLTGKLAEKRLNKVLQSMQPTEFTYEVKNIGVSVAALMTASMIKRRITNIDGVDKVIVPGLCRGKLEEVSDHLGVPVIRGTVDVKDIPPFFGRDCKPIDLSQHNVKIFAEIVDAPMIGIAEILQRAKRYKGDGADIIDIGCLPDTEFPHLEESIQALHNEGYKVSVDSSEEAELLRGGQAGADYLLSLKQSSLWITDKVDSIPVLIPESHTKMESLYQLIDQFSKEDRPFIADSILDPIHFGFTESLLRYHGLRQRYADIDIMMGIGNLTELTEADTSGINAVLFGLISELGITSVLATEVSPHTCSAVREADKARRMMFAAKREEGLPKGIDSSLLTTHARKPFPYTPEEIAELAEQVRDPSYRVEVSAAGIHVYNRDGLVTAEGAFELFPQLKLLEDDAPHAFYMGVELAKAQIASVLGKRYVQDEELDWGAAVADADEEDIEQASKIAHNLKNMQAKQDSEYKSEGTTLQASRKNKKKKRTS